MNTLIQNSKLHNIPRIDRYTRAKKKINGEKLLLSDIELDKFFDCGQGHSSKGERWCWLINRINWLEIKVTDIRKAIVFYRDVIGLKIKNEWSNYVIFDLVGTLTLTIMLGGRKGRKEGASNIYLAVDNVDEEYEKLKARGANFVKPPNKQYWGGYAALFADPDKNLFYLTQTKN